MIDLFAGLHSVDVTDANGCQETAVVSVPSPADLLPNITTDSVTCFGYSDGRAISTPSQEELLLILTHGMLDFQYLLLIQ